MISQEDRAYRQYLTGCDRLGQPPLERTEFMLRWQEFQDHAEKLKAAEANGDPPEIAPGVRAEMQRRVQNDPFVKALLVGMAEPETGPYSE